MQILPTITFSLLIYGAESLLVYFWDISKELKELPTDPFDAVLKIVCQSHDETIKNYV
jgi:hypothetical protein